MDFWAFLSIARFLAPGELYDVFSVKSFILLAFSSRYTDRCESCRAARVRGGFHGSSILGKAG